MARSKKYKDLLIEALKEPSEAVAYLNAILKEYNANDEESQKMLLIALKNVVKAQGGMAKIAQKALLGRESLYKTLSVRGNPKLATLTKIADAMGFDLQFRVSAK